LEVIYNFNIANVRNLSFATFNSENIDVEDLMNVLAKLPLLETLNLRFFTDFSNKNESKISALSFPLLRELKVIGQFCGFLKYFEVKNLTKFEIGWGELLHDDDYTVLIDFLNQKRNLESLKTCVDIFTRILEFQNQSQFEFQLKNLETNVFVTESFEKNFNAFLISQASSLKSLKVGEYWRSPTLQRHFVVKTIITKLNRLSSLKIHVSNLPNIILSYQ
jgi:hypothetical protein